MQDLKLQIQAAVARIASENGAEVIVHAQSGVIMVQKDTTAIFVQLNIVEHMVPTTHIKEAASRFVKEVTTISQPA